MQQNDNEVPLDDDLHPATEALTYAQAGAVFSDSVLNLMRTMYMPAIEPTDRATLGKLARSIAERGMHVMWPSRAVTFNVGDPDVGRAN